MLRPAPAAAPAKTDAMPRTFGFLLRDVSQRYVQRFEQHARTLSLSLSECRTLVLLEHDGRMNQAELARRVHEPPMAMVRLLDRMERGGLLERRADPSDRRARRPRLTARARPLLREIWRLAERTRDELFAHVSARERSQFMRVLERLHDTASHFPDPATPVRPARRRRA